MITAEIKEKVMALVQAVIEEQGAQLIEVKVGGHAQDALVVVTADKPAGGITIEECVRLNKALAHAIDTTGVLSPEGYSLEVSSPGLDRPLSSRKDFLRCAGKEIHLWLSLPVAGKKELHGILKDVGECDLTMEAAGQARLTVPLPAVIKGKMVI